MEPAPLRILVVEDSTPAQALVAGMLRDVWPEGIALSVAGRLDQAIVSLAALAIDVVLLDLSLPDSRGPATFHQLYSRVPRGVPVIVLTGLDDQQVALEAVRAGAPEGATSCFTLAAAGSLGA